MGILAALNKDAVKKVIADLGIQTAVDNMPKDLRDDIQPVIDMAPQRFTTIVKTATTSSTIYTAPAVTARRRLYLTGWSLSCTEGTDVTVEATITATLEDGSTVVIAAVQAGATAGVTIATANHNHTFAVPLPVLPGTAITLALNDADTARAIIYGYEVDIP